MCRQDQRPGQGVQCPFKAWVLGSSPSELTRSFPAVNSFQRNPTMHRAGPGLWGAGALVFMAVVCQVVFNLPGLSPIRRSLAELAHLARSKVEKLQMAPEHLSVRLGNVVGPVIHHAVLQIA